MCLENEHPYKLETEARKLDLTILITKSEGLKKNLRKVKEVYRQIIFAEVKNTKSPSLAFSPEYPLFIKELT